jgi:hypothetical protein
VVRSSELCHRDLEGKERRASDRSARRPLF